MKFGPEVFKVDVAHTCSQNATARLDKLKWSKWHTYTTILLATGWALDAFETSIMGPNLRFIQKEFGIESITEASWITSVWLAGGMIGALLFGMIGDRYGRKFTFIATILWYSLFTIVTSLSPSWYFFLIFRLITSIGVAGEYAAVTSSISEFVPSKHRGKISVLIQGSWCIGALIANLFNIPIQAALGETQGNLAWRLACSLGAISGFLTMFLRRNLPESPRWLLSKGRIDEAEKVVTEIEIMCGQPDNGVGVERSVYDVHQSVGFFKQCVSLWVIYPFRTIFACMLDLSQAFGGYGVSNFLALAILPGTVKDDRQGIFYTITSLGGFPGIAFSAILIDVIGRKKLLPLCYTICAIATIIIYPAYLAKSESVLIAVVFFYQMFYASSWGVGYGMYSEIFPTYIRSTGIGMAVCVGRLGGFFAPIGISYVFEKTGDGENIVGGLCLVVSFFLAAVFAAIPWAIYGTEGKGISLEDACLETKVVLPVGYEGRIKNDDEKK